MFFFNPNFSTFLPAFPGDGSQVLPWDSQGPQMLPAGGIELHDAHLAAGRIEMHRKLTQINKTKTKRIETTKIDSYRKK